jgi:hypothetical protein
MKLRAIVMLALFLLGGMWRSEAQRLPLDPLSGDEIQAAEKLARSDGRVREILGQGRHILCSIDFLAPKGEDGRPTGRHALVLFYRYEGNVGARAIIDLERQSVTQVDRINGDQVPMTFEELAAAWDIARRHPQVLDLLGSDANRFQVRTDSSLQTRGHEIEGMRIRASRSDSPCFKQRCVELLFRQPDGSYVTGFQVLVNLTYQQATVEPIPVPPAERRRS